MMCAVIMRRADGIVVQTVDDRAFLLDERGAEMIVLNPVGTMVWNALDGESDAGAIASSLVERFDDVSVAELDRDVKTFLDDLAAAGLVVPVTPT
jgi:hypothetical protein